MRGHEGAVAPQLSLLSASGPYCVRAESRGRARSGDSKAGGLNQEVATERHFWCFAPAFRRGRVFAPLAVVWIPAVS